MSKPHPLLRILIALVVAFCMTGLVASSATAQTTPEDYGDTVHVIQPKPVLQQGRFALTPRAGLTINDSMYRNFMVGASANFHLAERFYLGGLFQWYEFGESIDGPTQAFRDVRSATDADADAPFLNWAAGAEIGFVPIFGKFALFNRSIVYYDVALSAGGVYADSSSILEPVGNQGPGGTVSVSTRLFLSDWMAVNFEVRDVIYMGNVINTGSVLSHSVTAGLGLSLYLPTSFEYSEARAR
jgi:outer membrane beta-barrel protein